MGPFKVLYLDMNSFFASVEQQLDPALRGKPVGIAATEGLHGSIVAASYEAKAFGVKTGTLVRDAKVMCPDIILRPSRHRLYVRHNLAVARILDRHAELVRIRSVDEFQLALSGETTSLEGASELVSHLKKVVAEEAGECLRFSAGIGPNHLLAKIAGKLEKPNGFKWLWPGNMPEAVAHLELDDLPGISTAMKQRLLSAGVLDVPALCRLDPRHARAIWRSVEGERFVRSLQGMDIPLVVTKRGGYGAGKVLAPDFRRPLAAYLVSRWLVEKATARLRRSDRVAASFGLDISIGGERRWSRTISTEASQDTMAFLRVNRMLWRAAWPAIRGRTILSIGIQLGDVKHITERSGDLLTGLRPAERTSGERAARAIDAINSRFGTGTITYGVNQAHPGFFERG